MSLYPSPRPRPQVGMPRAHLGECTRGILEEGCSARVHAADLVGEVASRQGDQGAPLGDARQRAGPRRARNRRKFIGRRVQPASNHSKDGAFLYELVAPAHPDHSRAANPADPTPSVSFSAVAKSPSLSGPSATEMPA